jgi:hypothetical protein
MAPTRARFQKEEMQKQSLVRMRLISNRLMGDIRPERISCSAEGVEDDAWISNVRDVPDIGGLGTFLSKSNYSHYTDRAGKERAHG